MELGPSTIVGVGLALIGFVLYFVKTKKPDLSRDYDLFFSSVGLLCGGILIFQGWRLDPLLLLCQILSSATAIFFIGESLWLRGNKYKKKNVITRSFHSPLSPPNFKDVRRVDRTKISDKIFLKKYLFDQKSFAPQLPLHEVESLQVIPEEVFFPILLSSRSQIEHKSKDINKENYSSFFYLKKRDYKHKKKILDFNLKNKSDVEYANAIDYCHMSFCSKY